MLYLKKWREFVEKDVVDVSIATGIPKEAIECMEDGSIEPSLSEMMKIAESLGVPLEDIVSFDPRKVAIKNRKLYLHDSKSSIYADSIVYLGQFTVYTNNHTYAVRLQRWLNSKGIWNDIYVLTNQTAAEKYFQTPADELYICL